MSHFSRRQFLALCLGAASAFPGVPRSLTQAHQAKVVVIGGGYGGLNAARVMQQLAPELQITLIERDRRYTSCPGSNRVIAGLDSTEGLIHQLSPARLPGLRVIIGSVVQIETLKRQIRLRDGSVLPYDRLIISPGMDFRWDALDGYGEPESQYIPHAWKAGEQTLMLQRQIKAMRPGGTVVISVPDNPYRCPPGPYERASLIAFFLRRHNPKAKILILDAKTRFSKQAAFTHAWNTLYPGMIEWVSSESMGRIDHIESKKRIVTCEFDRFRADVLNIIPPQKAGNLAQITGLTDSSGWCPVDPLSFESTLAPDIHVIGDACAALPMPKSAFAAQSQAGLCGASVLARLSDQDLPSSKLINHCYSFVAPDRAISVTAVYGYSRNKRALEALSSDETGPNDDWAKEANYARKWYSLISLQTFG